MRFQDVRRFKLKQLLITDKTVIHSIKSCKTSGKPLSFKASFERKSLPVFHINLTFVLFNSNFSMRGLIYLSFFAF